MESGEKPWPTEVRLRDHGRTLAIAFDDGRTFSMTAEYLRVSSPSAEVRGHSPSERKTVAGKIDVVVRDLLPVGNYAVRPVFDDGHETGIFTWEYLREMGERQSDKWAAYLAELSEKKLTRER